MPKGENKMLFTTKQLLDFFVEFMMLAKRDDFIQCFGQEVGSHLWQRYVRTSYRADEFYRLLSKKGREDFSEFITAKLSQVRMDNPKGWEL